jgi:hypothetical protein
VEDQSNTTVNYSNKEVIFAMQSKKYLRVTMQEMNCCKNKGIGKGWQRKARQHLAKRPKLYYSQLQQQRSDLMLCREKSSKSDKAGNELLQKQKHRQGVAKKSKAASGKFVDMAALLAPAATGFTKLDMDH